MIKAKIFGAYFVACAMIATSLVSCKKNKKVDPTPIVPPVTSTTASRADLTKDSIFLYAKEIYLWNDALPSYETFNPRSYSSASPDLANYNAELFALTQLKINPATSKPFEYSGTTSAKYSYIFDSANKNPTASIIDTKSSVDLEGNGNDFGIKAQGYGTNTNYKIMLLAAYPGSPIQKAGLTRGAYISTINGQAFGSNYPGEVTAINTYLNSNSITISGVKADGTPFNNITLVKSTYSSSPVLKDSVLISGSKKVGYLAFARFSNAATAEGALTNVFAKFTAAGVNNLVIDLRYNGGGYVSTAQHLVNLIAPASLNNQTMFTEYYNATMQSGSANILANQPLLDGNNKIRYQNGKMLTYANVDYSVAGNTEHFAKVGGLEGIASVVFIVSGNTASASELVINSLKPHMNVKLIGTTTYGKPVGFFPIRLENKYDVYFSLFQTKNSLGEGEYFPGFTPNLVDTYDDAFHDFGDRTENYLAKAINYITTGTLAVTNNKTITIKGEKFNTSTLEAKDLTADNDFKGMIENRFKLKQQ